MQTCFLFTLSRGSQKRGHRAQLKALQHRSAGFAGEKVDAGVQSFFSPSAGDCEKRCHRVRLKVFQRRSAGFAEEKVDAGVPSII